MFLCLFLLFACVVSAPSVGAAERAPAERPAASGWPGAPFRGLSLARVRGDAGLGALNAACASSWPRSRVCLEEEVFAGGGDAAPSDEGWVLSRGLLSPGAASCYEPRTGFFTETAGEGTVATADGNFARRACVETLAVACCG